MLQQGGEEDLQLPVSTLSKPGLGLIRYPEREATSWKKRKKRGEKAFECLVREVDNGWPMKHVDGEETKRWRVFLFSFLFSLVWTKWRSFDSNIVHARGSEFVWNNNLYFPIAIVFLWRPPLCSRFKRKIKKEREKNVTGRYRVQEIYDKGRVGANGICEYMNVYIIIKNICFLLLLFDILDLRSRIMRIVNRIS